MATTRFTPNTFQYNGRVALALVPCLVTSAAIGGPSVVACLSIGAMVVYLMDALQYRDGALTTSWATLVAAMFAFYYSLLASMEVPVFIQVGLLVVQLLLTLLAGMWASLQFRWIQVQYPAVAIVFERYVLTGSMPIAAIMHTLGLAMFVPYADIPFYLATILAGLYYLLGRPLPSSFYNAKSTSAVLGGGGGPGPEAFVQSRIDGALLALVTALLPSLCYAAIHWVVLDHRMHVYALLMLAGAMPLFIALLPHGLWWLPGAPVVVRGMRRIIISIALLTALVGFEGRVVFHSFGQFIKLHPPWDWLAVTFALFGTAGVVLMHLNGTLGSSVDVTVAGSLLLLCTTAGSLATGVPFHWLPAPLVAACGLSLFYESRSLREYMVFVLGAFATGVWFVLHHYWFLDIAVGGTHLHALVQLALAAMVPALLVPGMVCAKASASTIGSLLVAQAAMVSLIEERMFQAGHTDENEDGVMYPGYLVVATSLMGLMAARRLAALGHVQSGSLWLLYSLYIGKLMMLLMPEAFLVLPCTLLAGATLAPYFMHGPSPLNNARLYPAGAPERSRPRSVRLAPWQGLTHFATIAVAVGLARFAVFDTVQYLISARPTEGLLLGALVLVLAACCFPLVSHCYASNQAVSRAVVGLAMIGGMIAMLQPPLPAVGGARCPKLPLALCPRLWDERHVPMHSAEDVQIWGMGLGRREHWPRWLLVSAVAAGMVAASGGGGQAVTVAARTVAGRLVFAVSAGLLVGGYISLELLPSQLIMQVLLTITTVLVVAFVVLLQLPRAAGPITLPLVAVLWGILSVLALLLHSQLSVPVDGLEERLFPDSAEQVKEALYAATKASLLAVVASHALLMAFALKLKMGSALRTKDTASRVSDSGGSGSLGYPHMPTRRTSGFGASSRSLNNGMPAVSELFCGVVPSNVFARFGSMLQVEGAEATALQRLSNDGLGWVPTLGNALALTAAVLAMALNYFITGGAPEAIFMVAPVLLLLSADPVLFPGLSDRKRYFPPAATISSYLLAMCLVQAVMTVYAAISAEGLSVLVDQWLWLLKPFVLIVFATPAHLRALTYLWTMKAVGPLQLLLMAPMAVVAAALCSDGEETLRYYSASGAIIAVVLYFSMRHVKHVGMKVI